VSLAGNYGVTLRTLQLLPIAQTDLCPAAIEGQGKISGNLKIETLKFFDEQMPTVPF
jgi:hypothetical protein